MDGLGNSHFSMDDDWGYPYDSGNHQMSIARCGMRPHLSIQSSTEQHIPSGKGGKASAVGELKS